MKTLDATTVHELTRKPIKLRAIHLTNAIAVGFAVGISGRKLDYVARGHEHPLRHEREEDRGNGHILEGAPDFFVTVDPSSTGVVDGKIRRYPMGSWLVEEESGEWIVRTADEVAQNFDGQVQ